MGITNIVKFFRRSLEYDVPFPDAYNLAIDSSLILVPLIKSSRTTEEFERNFRAYFARNAKLCQILGGASEIFVGLDYYYPTMKRETCRKRRNQNQRQLEKRMGDGTPVSPTTLAAANSTTTTTTTSTGIPSSIGTASSGTLAANQTTCDVERYVKEETLRLRDIRYRVEMLFKECLRHWRLSFPNANAGGGGAGAPDGQRVTFDVLNHGEGEIKCFKYTNWRNLHYPTVILSNDNDVLLMILMHGAMSDYSKKTRFFRLTHVPSQVSVVPKCSLNEISLRTVLYQQYEQNFGTQCYTTDYQMIINEFNSWIIVTWLLATYGSDYVNALQPSSAADKNRRRKKKCGDGEDAGEGESIATSSSGGSSSSVGGGGSCKSNDTSAKIALDWMDRAIEVYKEMVNDGRCMVLNAHTFFLVLITLFDVVANQTRTIDMDEEEVRYRDHRSYGAPIDTCDVETMNVYTWCVRLYWNVLYLRDLPVDFTGTFATDKNVPINLNLPKVSLSENTVRKLTPAQRCKLHDMLCFYMDRLGSFKQNFAAPDS